MKKYKPQKMISQSRFRYYFKTWNSDEQDLLLRKMQQLLSENSDYADDKNYGHLCNLITSLAMVMVLEENGKARSEAEKAVADAMYKFIEPQIKSMVNKIKRGMEATEEEMTSHVEAEDAINKKAKVLITPPIKKEQRNSPKQKDEVSKKEKVDKPEDEYRRLRIPKKYQGTNANVRFDTMHYGQRGVMFEAEQEGKTTVIRWNVDHPFYTRFVRENADNKTLVTSVDFLIYSLAVAQIQAIGEDDDKAQMIENVISTMSTNMKVLLS